MCLCVCCVCGPCQMCMYACTCSLTTRGRGCAPVKTEDQRKKKLVFLDCIRRAPASRCARIALSLLAKEWSRSKTLCTAQVHTHIHRARLLSRCTLRWPPRLRCTRAVPGLGTARCLCRMPVSHCVWGREPVNQQVGCRRLPSTRHSHYCRTRERSSGQSGLAAYAERPLAVLLPQERGAWSQ